LDLINKSIDTITHQLNLLPSGKLSVKQCKSNFKWYLTDNGRKIYLPKSQKSLVEDLAKKKYLSFKLDELIQERKACLHYLKCFSDTSLKSEQFLSNPLYFSLLKSSFKPKSQFHEDWINAIYDKNIKRPENLIHKSLSTNIVRSKSEAMIDTALFQHNIPFRYECLLQLNELYLYPDFTIMHPITNKIYYWEHFGMMDNPIYAKKTFSKLQIYNSNNITPSINLITTYETKDAPLDIYHIEKIIDFYFK